MHLAQKNVILLIDDLKDEKYKVQKYDTWTGVLSEGFETSIVNNRLMIENYNLAGEHDVALYLQSLE